jgi:hypothetical protein
VRRAESLGSVEDRCGARAPTLVPMKTLWWSRRAITLHLALVVAVPLFLTLATWQLHRALQGNLLSWAYTFEWPFFAGYASWMWWRLVHEETATAADLVPAIGRRHAALALGSRPDGSEVGGAAADGAEEAGEAGAVGPSTTTAASTPAPRADYDPFDDADPELAAYNRYLAGLHADHPKQ